MKVIGLTESNSLTKIMELAYVNRPNSQNWRRHFAHTLPNFYRRGSKRATFVATSIRLVSKPSNVCEI